MVDATKGVSSVQPPTQNQKSNTSVRSTETNRAESVSDRVEISEDAQSLQVLDTTLNTTRSQIANSNEPLGLDPDFIQEFLSE